MLVDVVAGLGALRRGRSRRRTKEAMYLLLLPSRMHAAVSLGWSQAELERWLTESLEALLLDSSYDPASSASIADRRDSQRPYFLRKPP